MTVSRVSGATMNTNSAKFTLIVNAPTNTAPVVAVAGVSNGASYQHGAVPTPTCTVTDAEDSNPTATPSVTAVTGPLAAYGLGSRTATGSYTDGGGITRTASATYTIVDTTLPVLNTPGDQVLEATGPGGASRHVDRDGQRQRRPGRPRLLLSRVRPHLRPGPAHGDLLGDGRRGQHPLGHLQGHGP